MVGNPYRSPGYGFSRDDATSRYGAQKNKMRRRLLGGVAAIAGLCLVLLAFGIRELLVCEQIGLGNSVGYLTRVERRPAWVVGGAGIALIALGAAASNVGRRERF